MSLASVISSASSRGEQSQRVEAYWALTSASADYYLGLAEVRELEALRQQVSTYNRPLSEAQTNIATRVDTSLKAAKAAQYRLSRLMGGGVMPLPADTPFTGPYATRFESVFASGGSEEARLLHDLLPLRLAELQDAGDAVARSQAWVDRVAGDQSNRSDGTGILRAMELLALNRRAFVMIARDYNLQINRYAQLASPDRVDTGRLVAMLIRTPSADTGLADDALMAGFSTGSNSSANRDFRSGSPARR